MFMIDSDEFVREAGWCACESFIKVMKMFGK
jgi:predicted nucleic acid-binding Zn finger protein